MPRRKYPTRVSGIRWVMQRWKLPQEWLEIGAGFEHSHANRIYRGLIRPEQPTLEKFVKSIESHGGRPLDTDDLRALLLWTDDPVKSLPKRSRRQPSGSGRRGPVRDRVARILDWSVAKAIEHGLLGYWLELEGQLSPMTARRTLVRRLMDELERPSFRVYLRKRGMPETWAEAGLALEEFAQKRGQ